MLNHNPQREKWVSAAVWENTRGHCHGVPQQPRKFCPATVIWTFYLFMSHINNTWLAVLLQRLHVWVKAWFLQSNMPEAFYPLLVPFIPTMMPILQLRKLTHKDTSGSFWTKTKVDLIPGPESLTDILQPSPPSCFNLHTRFLFRGFASAVTSTSTMLPLSISTPSTYPKCSCSLRF